MDINQDSEKQYLEWYYEHLKSVSKIQARLTFNRSIQVLFINTIFEY